MNTEFNKLWKNTVREEETAQFLFEHWADLSQAAPKLQTLVSLAAMEACREVRAPLNIREVWLLVCKPTPLHNQMGHSFYTHGENEEQSQRLRVATAQSLKRQFLPTSAQGNGVSMMSALLLPNGNTAVHRSWSLLQFPQEMPLFATSTCSVFIRNWLEWERHQQAQILSRMH